MADEPDDDEDGDQITRILAAKAAPEGMLLLATVYEQSDAMNPAGQVYLTTMAAEGEADLILTANEGLSSLWVSPEGHAWVGGQDGDLWTTAPVSMPPPHVAGLDFDAPDARFSWTVTTLPNLRQTGRPPSLSALWGTGDASVFAATVEGAIYRWDGSSWAEMTTNVTSQLIEIHGTADDDVFCVGHDAVILHFDGSAWTRIPGPEGLDPWAVLTGVRTAGRQGAVIVEVLGAVLEGDRGGFRIVARDDRAWHGVARFQDRWILAANPGGAWELTSAGLAPLKTNFDAVDLDEAGDLLVFIESEQDPRPSVIVHDPADTASPWQRRVF